MKQGFGLLHSFKQKSFIIKYLHNYPRSRTKRMRLQTFFQRRLSNLRRGKRWNINTKVIK